MPSRDLNSLRQQVEDLQRQNTLLEQRLASHQAHDQDFYRSLFDTMDEGFCIIELVFDAMCWLAAGRASQHPSVRLTQAQFHWGLRREADLAQAHPRLQLVAAACSKAQAAACCCSTFDCTSSFSMLCLLKPFAYKLRREKSFCVQNETKLR